MPARGSKLCQGKLKLGLGEHFFPEGAVKHWNGLLRVVDAPSLSVFQGNLDNALVIML